MVPREKVSRAIAAIVFGSIVAIPGEWARGGTLSATVQSGTLTSAADGIVTATISPVDPTRAFLIFSTRHNSFRPTGSMVRGTIATPTTVEFTRVANDSSTVMIQWYVVEYESGIRVQRGEINQDETTLNVPISPLASASQAFVTWSKTPGSANNNFDSRTPIYIDLPAPPTPPDHLIIRAGLAAPGNRIAWQVVEFLDPATINVQRGTLALGINDLTTEATLPTPVNTSSSFLLVGNITDYIGGPNIGAHLLRGQLLDSTTVRVDRSISGVGLSEIGWQVVELGDGSLVQRGSANFAPGENLEVVNVSNVELSRAVPLASSQPIGGQNTGRSPYSDDDIPGVASVTLAMTGSDVFLTRENTAAPADIGWFVVEWGPSAQAPTAISLNPTSGQSRGGDPVSLLGSNFTPGTMVYFDDTVASSVTVQSSNSLIAVTPPHSPGTVNVTVSSEFGTDSIVNGFTYDPPVPFIRGDANGDSGFDVADGVFVIQYLFNPPAPAPNCFDSADANDDGALNISDIVFGLSFLFQDGLAPPAPFPTCELDPTGDGLGCVLHTGCP